MTKQWKKMATIGAVFGTNLYKTGTTNFTDAELKNANQDWQDVSGSGIPADGATVGAVFGTNLYKTGTTNFTEAELKNNQIGIVGVGYWATNIINTLEQIKFKNIHCYFGCLLIMISIVNAN